MNYYNPNFYQNNPYGNNQQPMPYQPLPMSPSLNGKFVDNVDVLKVTEVPIGGYGIFPKADLSEVYIKYQNKNGTTDTITYKPFQSPEPVQEQAMVDTKAVLERLNALESKLNSALKQASPQQKKENKKYEY